MSLIFNKGITVFNQTIAAEDIVGQDFDPVAGDVLSYQVVCEVDGLDVAVLQWSKTFAAGEVAAFANTNIKTMLQKIWDRDSNLNAVATPFVYLDSGSSTAINILTLADLLDLDFEIANTAVGTFRYKNVVVKTGAVGSWKVDAGHAYSAAAEDNSGKYGLALLTGVAGYAMGKAKS